MKNEFEKKNDLYRRRVCFASSSLVNILLDSRYEMPGLAERFERDFYDQYARRTNFISTI